MAKARRQQQDVRGVIDCSDGVDSGEASLAGVALNQYGRTGGGGPPAATVSDEVVYVVYIVNPRGCVHECTYEHARWRLARDPRYRYATDAEVAAYRDGGGNQMYPSVSGKPFVV